MLDNFNLKLAWEISYFLIFLILSFATLYFIATSIKYLLNKNGLPEDLDMVVDPFNNNVHYAVSYWTEKGGRPYQEDRHDEIKGKGKDDSSIYGVFDGHGGMKAAQFCKENLLKNILMDPNFIEEPSKALQRAFFRTDAEFSAIAKVKNLTDGTTAVVAVVHGKRIYVANAGDSRCILVQKGGKSKAMSIDHKPNRPDEEKRIIDLGGKVIHWGRWRVQGILAVSRAIGDVSLQPYITCEPEIIEKDIISNEDEFLVLASDGLWDVLSNEMVAKLVMEKAPKDFLNSAKILCDESLLAGSTDNVTVVIVDLRNRLKSVSNSKSTEMLYLSRQRKN